MSRHTPGPWMWTPSGDIMRDKYSQPLAVAQHMQPNLVCGCFGDVRGGHETAEANARLIAAAPDLLSALQDLIAICEVRAPDHNLSLERARAAIQRATEDE